MILLLGIILISCSEKNQLPYCRIVDKSWTVQQGPRILVPIEARDNDGRIDHIEISINDGSLTMLESPSDLFLYWFESATLPAGEYVFKAVAVDDQGGESEDRWEFDIEGLEIVFPKGGEVLRQGTTYTVEWTTSTDDDLKIYLVDMDGNLKFIKEVEASKGKYSWWTLGSVQPGKYRLKIQKKYDEDFVAITDLPFEIKEKKNLKVDWFSEEFYSQYLEHHDLFRGERVAIWWEDNISESVKIEVCRWSIKEAYDNGYFSERQEIETYMVLEEAYRNSGSYVWTIPEDFPISQQNYEGVHEENSYLYGIRITSNTDTSYSELTKQGAFISDTDFLSSLEIREDEYVPGSRIQFYWLGDHQVRYYLKGFNNAQTGIMSGEVDNPFSWGNTYFYGAQSFIPTKDVSPGESYRLVVESRDNPPLKLYSEPLTIQTAPYDITGEWDFNVILPGVHLETDGRRYNINADGTFNVSYEDETFEWGYEDGGFTFGTNAGYSTCHLYRNDYCWEREDYRLMPGEIESATRISGKVYVDYGKTSSMASGTGTYIMTKK